MAGQEQRPTSDPDPEVAGTVAEPVRQVAERARRQFERELQAHRRAIQRHEEAAAVHERYGRPDRAEAARKHAAHARQLLERAQREQQCFEQRFEQWRLDPPQV